MAPVAQNNAKNNANNNANNDLANNLKDKLENIKLTTNKKVIAYWVVWIIVIVLLLSTFITTPIRYSEKTLIYGITYNRLYYYLYVLLVGLICLYAYMASTRLPLIRGEDMYLKLIPIVIFVLALIVINIVDSKGESEDGSFSTPESTMVRNKSIMIFQLTLLIVGILVLMGLDVSNNVKDLSQLLFGHVYRSGYAIVALIASCYLMYNTIIYRVEKYNLPNTWKKKT
jgi:hypothetical protein